MDAEDYNNHSNSHLRCPKHSFLYNNSDESGSNEPSEAQGNEEYVRREERSLDLSDSEDFQDRNVDFNCSRNGQSHHVHHSLRDSPGKHRMVTKTKPWSIDGEKSVTVLEHGPNVSSQTVPLPLGSHVLTMMPNNRSCANESWAVLGNSAPSSIEAGRTLSCPVYGNTRPEDPSIRHASMSTERRGKRSRSSSSRNQKKKKKRKRKQRKRPRPFCMSQTIENFRTFCNQTSLHGWQYIAQKHSSSAKHVFWAMIVSLSMATASFFLYNNTMDFMDATVSEHFRDLLPLHDYCHNVDQRDTRSPVTLEINGFGLYEYTTFRFNSP
ncbi:hypothetical protein TCAL_07642 [Tigriopus californicus]|uniref:Uncharacterized protein n=1 Tax=Tigriopus californicus TaxID=6832 RepID=A0A553NPW3_TIGCA|nr:hypothetical protein TCAL_07642 [Tigriopus californicus]|eukprot:TCALIF_07642-PA protein Name:"Protein of unknown function" AED:0.60 eAED:0.60 QI:83/1/0.5/1/1/1/2/0/323